MIDSHKCPEVHRNINGYIDTHARTHWCPTVVVVTLTPIYPCWSPFIVRNPSPTITVIVVPTTIVKWSPTPVIVGYPGITIVGHCPITIGGIRLEVRANVRNPNIAIIGVINPFSVRGELIIEHLERNSSIVIIVITIISTPLGH
ncbi:hypothetical protein D3C71_1054940 [compost metagenome]